MLTVLSCAGLLLADEPPRTLLLVAGPDSHAKGDHEHHAGCVLLAEWINRADVGVHAIVSSGWPDDPGVVERADAIVVYADGEGGGTVMRQLDALHAAAERGAGIALLHYALAVPRGAPGGKVLEWIGGYYENHWSVNPFWTARIERLPEHPVTRGVNPFALRDEWYFHMRFRQDMEGVLPVLEAVPPDEVREGPDGAHSGNPVVRARRGMHETLAWVAERPGGGRGFGFTGGHYHWNWAQDDYRTLVLNALVWVSGGGVPEEGVPSERPTAAELLRVLPNPPPELTEQVVETRLQAITGQP